jgi:hypothetical protein
METGKYERKKKKNESTYKDGAGLKRRLHDFWY